MCQQFTCKPHLRIKLHRIFISRDCTAFCFLSLFHPSLELKIRSTGMDNRLVLAILFVTLSWLSMGTYAQSNTTTATASMTTMGNNMTNATMAPTMTTMGNNMTNATMAPTMTTMGNNMTNATMAPSMTTMGNNMANATMASNMTTMGNNMANATMASNMTTVGNNMANATMASNMTTMGNNMANATMASNMTTMGNMTNATMAPTMTTMGNNMVTTAVPPLTPNTTVETLETPVNNSGCGTEQLCAAEPSSCNPSDSGSCFFLGAKRLSGQNFEFVLSGESDGYIAASLSTDSTLGGNDTTYVCANNNSNVQFFGALLNNGQLTVTEQNVNSVRGRVTGNRIQCTFAATVPSLVARTTSFALAISTGPYNATSGDLGPPTTRLESPVINLANPNATVINNLSTTNTTSPPMTTGHATTLQQSLTQALLISAGLLGLAML